MTDHGMKFKMTKLLYKTMQPYYDFTRPLEKEDAQKGAIAFLGDRWTPKWFKEYKEDLMDDLVNCGGNPLYRINELIEVTPLLDLEQRSIIVELFTDSLTAYIQKL